MQHGHSQSKSMIASASMNMSSTQVGPPPKGAAEGSSSAIRSQLGGKSLALEGSVATSRNPKMSNLYSSVGMTSNSIVGHAGTKSLVTSQGSTLLQDQPVSLSYTERANIRVSAAALLQHRMNFLFQGFRNFVFRTVDH